MIKWEYLEFILTFFKRAYSKSHNWNIASSRNPNHNQYASWNPYERQTCKSSRSQDGAQRVCSSGLELLHPRADHKGSASSATPCQNPVGFPGSSYCCLLTIPADWKGNPLQELCYCPAKSINGPFWALTARSPYWWGGVENAAGREEFPALVLLAGDNGNTTKQHTQIKKQPIFTSSNPKGQHGS